MLRSTLPLRRIIVQVADDFRTQQPEVVHVAPNGLSWRQVFFQPYPGARPGVQIAAVRGGIVLTTTRDNRPAVVELKADEDIHLPLQGLDYWSRVQWHHSRTEFPRFGYFAGRELSSDPPLLFLVAPAQHVHPATDTQLNYFSPEIEWEFVGIDERWREGVEVVFRKHSKRAANAAAPPLAREAS